MAYLFLFPRLCTLLISLVFVWYSVSPLKKQHFSNFFCSHRPPRHLGCTVLRWQRLRPEHWVDGHLESPNIGCTVQSSLLLLNKKPGSCSLAEVDDCIVVWTNIILSDPQASRVCCVLSVRQAEQNPMPWAAPGTDEVLNTEPESSLPQGESGVWSFSATRFVLSQLEGLWRMLACWSKLQALLSVALSI